MTNKTIARHLKDTAALLELAGANPYRIRAFERAARTLGRLEDPVQDRVKAGTLTRLPGIGDGLAAQVSELVTTGSLALYDELIAGLPPGLPDLLSVKGLGATRTRTLWKTLDVTSLDDLERAARSGRLLAVDGFGEKIRDALLEQIVLLRSYQQRRRYADVHAACTPLLDDLRRFPSLLRVEPTGALRRGNVTLDAAELIAAVSDETAAREALRSAFPAATDTPEGMAAHLPDGLPLIIRFAPPDAFGTRWWQSTGNSEHVASLTTACGPPGLHAEEEDLFAASGLSFVAPELREGRGEVEAAARGTLPRLITEADLQGSLHNHSTYSDGAHSLREMADRAREMGLSYFGIADHSRSLRIAHGMSIETVREQHRDILSLNESYASDGGLPFRVFAGVESDILADGSLDYPDEVLAAFDFVVASVHTRFTMTEDEATARVIRAVAHPYTTILGHPTGRLLLTREGYPLDHRAVIAACAEHGVAIELNAHPYRLDLDWRWIREATDRGVPIAINPDAHAVDGLALVTWGVAAARKGWLSPSQCLNALSTDDFTAWLAERKPAS